ncbi:hypothetical protein BY458DRAFT_533162 [Sporodiniella umbellata]|nr:hypothetical protein BY458DRAFT_533162 [Sporodiniella umbellata]
MKIWSPLFVSLLLISGLKAQFEDEQVTIEVVEDDLGSSDGFIVEADSEPCNGYPQYRKLPINQAFYLGSTANKNVDTLLNQGMRYFEWDICQNAQDDLVICSTGKTFESALNEAFLFAREVPEQFFIVHVNTQIENQKIETNMDTLCKKHTELTPGTDEYTQFKCPFFYKHEGGPWPSIGELVNYNPEQAQWEGDGELVGVRTRMLFTMDTPSSLSSFFTKPFWRNIKGLDSSELKQELKKNCRVPAGGVKLNAFTNKKLTPKEIEEFLLDRSGCNLNDSPLNTFVSILNVQTYEQEQPYFDELKDRMMDLNVAKWNGEYELLKPSTLARKVQRDEL